MASKSNVGLALIFFLVPLGCQKQSRLVIPSIDEAPKVTEASVQTMKESAPAYGIAVSARLFEVNVEAEDSPLVKPGTSAEVFVTPSPKAIACHVARVLHSASTETGQSLAWLTPDEPSAAVAGDFVSAGLVIRKKEKALAVPSSAVLVRDGRTFCVTKTSKTSGKEDWKVREVQPGITTGGMTEILSGLKQGDEVVTQGGLGLLLPEFRASAD